MGGCESWKLLLITTLLTLVYSVRAQDPFVCLDNGNYTRNSTYRANLNTLLSSLSSNMIDNGFYNGSVGQSQDRVNALALCRGDQTVDRCRTCVQSASESLPQQCPNQKQAIIWYEVCTLRYSNESIFGTQTTEPVRGLRNGANVVSPNEFRTARKRLYDALRGQAADGGSGLKVGAGVTNISESQPLYGMMQCSPDLSAEECDNCLQQAAVAFQECCDTAAGLRALMPSCNLRYELYSFYNETRLRELQVAPLSLWPSPPPSSPPPLPSPPPGSY